MDKTRLIALRNEIGSLSALEGEVVTADNIAIALASYFEQRLDRPEDDEIDSELGWSKWAIEQTDNALDRIVKHLAQAHDGS